MEWLYIGIILLMRVVQNVFVKINSSSVPKNSVGYIKYTSFYQGLASVFALALFIISLFTDGGSIPNVGETLLYATVSGVCLSIACCCSLYCLSNGTMVLNSLFGTAGLLVPTIISIFLYDEKLSPLQWVAIGLFLVGAYLLSASSKKTYGKFNLKTLGVLILSLVSNGVTMLMQTMFGRNIENGNVSFFSFVSFIAGVLILLLLLVIIKVIAKKKGEVDEENKKENTDFVLIPSKNDNVNLTKKVYIYAVFLAVAVFVINQLVTITTPLMEPVILFAFVNGGHTIISAIVGAIMYKEKMNIQTILGLIVGLGSLILLKVFAL